MSYIFPILAFMYLHFLFVVPNEIFQIGLGSFSVLALCPLIGLFVAFVMVGRLASRYPAYSSFSECVNASSVIAPFKLWMVFGGISLLVALSPYLVRVVIIVNTLLQVPFLLALGLVGLLVLVIGYFIVSRWLLWSSAVVVVFAALFSVLIFVDGVPAFVANAHILNLFGSTKISLFGDSYRTIRYVSVSCMYAGLFMSYPFAELLFGMVRSGRGLVWLLAVGFLSSLICFVGFYATVYGLKSDAVQEVTDVYFSYRFASKDYGGIILVLLLVTIIGVVMVGILAALFYTKMVVIGEKFKSWLYGVACPVLGIILSLGIDVESFRWWQQEGVFWYSSFLVITLMASLLFSFSRRTQWVLCALSLLVAGIFATLKGLGVFFTIDILQFFMLILQVFFVLVALLFHG
ncbi:MAG: hypothetical protein QM538_01220 [Methylacidiphilales bacterium]|nr:hypothetical protein [Candidatus Methylacidiphilales bacterium]